MFAELRQLIKYRELLLTMVEREIKVRYKHSALGFIWSFVNPLITVGVIWWWQRYIAHNNTPNISAYILAGYLPYSFFTTSVMDATSSVTSNLGIIKKIYFPREIFPLASILSNFFHLFLAMIVFFFYLLGLYIFNPGHSPFVATVLYLPLIMLIQFILCCGLGFLFSALNTFFEDVKYMVSVMMWMMFFLTPVMNFVEDIYYAPHGLNRYRLYNFLNPMTIIVNAYRKVLLPLQPVTVSGTVHPALGIAWTHIAYAAFISCVIFVVGYGTFNKLKPRFVERV